MRRKGNFVPLLVGIVLALVIGVAFFVFLPPAKGKMEQGSGLVDKAGEGLVDFRCENINHPATNSVTFDEFLQAMYKVYNACGGADAKCGFESCETMKLDLGGAGMGADGAGDGTYREVTMRELESVKLSMFVNYLIDVSGGLGGLGANIYCERDNADWNDYEINPYYSGGNFQRINYFSSVTVKSGSKIICDDFDWSAYQSGKSGRFTVADGSKITIRAVKPPEWGGSVDLKVAVKGGRYVTKETVAAPPAPACTEDNGCNAAPNPPWRYCNEKNSPKTCEYYGYCVNRPTDTARCKQHVTLTCTLNGGCADSANPSLKYVCANGYALSVVKLEEVNNDGILWLETSISDSSNTGGAAVFTKGEEKWFKGSALWGVVNAEPSDKDAKMSVAVTKIYQSGSTYTVTLLQGCY